MNEEGRLSNAIAEINQKENVMNQAIAEGKVSQIEIKNMYVDIIHDIEDLKKSLPNVESDEVDWVKNQLGYIQGRISANFRNYVGDNVDFGSYENIKESFEKFGVSPKK